MKNQIAKASSKGKKYSEFLTENREYIRKSTIKYF